MAEIEHFVDPLDKSHPKFCLVQDDILPLWTATAQENNEPVLDNMTLRQALDNGVI